MLKGGARHGVADLVPHAGRMCLLETVEHWDDAAVVCTSRTHVAADHPLRGGSGLLAVHLVEYGAQAAAVHGALRSGSKAQPGMLVALRDVTFATARIDDIPSPLRVEARLQFADANGSLYAFSVSAGGAPLASGRLSIMTTAAAAP